MNVIIGNTSTLVRGIAVLDTFSWTTHFWIPGRIPEASCPDKKGPLPVDQMENSLLDSLTNLMWIAGERFA